MPVNDSPADEAEKWNACQAKAEAAFSFWSFEVGISRFQDHLRCGLAGLPGVRWDVNLDVSSHLRGHSVSIWDANVRNGGVGST